MWCQLWNMYMWCKEESQADWSCTKVWYLLNSGLLKHTLISFHSYPICTVYLGSLVKVLIHSCHFCWPFHGSLLLAEETSYPGIQSPLFLTTWTRSLCFYNMCCPWFGCFPALEGLPHFYAWKSQLGAVGKRASRLQLWSQPPITVVLGVCCPTSQSLILHTR